jgi:hypothetical protein
MFITLELKAKNKFYKELNKSQLKSTKDLNKKRLITVNSQENNNKN